MSVEAARALLQTALDFSPDAATKALAMRVLAELAGCRDPAVSSTDRSRQFRERQRQRNETKCNAPATASVTKTLQNVAACTSPISSSSDLFSLSPSESLSQEIETTSKVSGAGARERRGTRVPARLDDAGDDEAAVRAWASKWKIPHESPEFLAFVTYWRGEARREAVKLDWLSAWRTWMRRSGNGSATKTLHAARAVQPPGGAWKVGDGK